MSRSSATGVLLGLSGLAWGQETAMPEAGSVQWSASFSQSAAKVGTSTVLEVTGEIEDGWHVYALTQKSGGPTALRVTIDENDIAQPSGTASGSTPQKRRDPSFGMETQFYTHIFSVHIPVLIKQQTSPGKQLVPVSVHFQMCSDRLCEPPTTKRLSVSLEILPTGA